MSRVLIVVTGLLIGGGAWYWWDMSKEMPPEVQQPPEIQIEANTQPPSKTALVSAGISEQNTTKVYKSEEFGFEFEYPSSWDLATNVFYSPFSKINLTVSLPGDNNVVLYSFLVNVVTPDFADNALISKTRRGAVESSVVLDGIQGKKHEYTMDGGLSAVSVDIPIGEYRALIVVDKKHEAEFNQILASIKFRK